MFEFNKKTNLLESTVQTYPLVDVREPNLYREYFNYDEIPKVVFNHRVVPIDVPNEIWITDTTFRDGQQSRQPYTCLLYTATLSHAAGIMYQVPGQFGDSFIHISSLLYSVSI